MKTYTVGVIGATGRGNYGHGIDTVWLDLPNTKIIAVADENENGRRQAGQRLHCDRLFADYRRLLQEARPDIVAICPRHLDQHAEMIIAAAELGVHCFVEKPFCRNLTEADAIVKACEKSNTKVAIAHPTRYAPVMQTMRQLIDDGAIGRVLELRGRGKEDRRGGGEDLWVLGSHIMDMVLNLGFTPEWCFADVVLDGRRITEADVYDGAEGIGPLAGDAVRATYGVQGPDGDDITYTFQSYRNAGGNPRRFALQIYGSKGILEVQENVLAPVWILQDASWNPGRGGGTWKPVTTAGIDQPEPLTDPKYRSRNQVPVEDLLDAIEMDRQPECSMYEGRKIVEMTAAVFESHRLNRPVKFPLETRVNPLTLL
ncbi:MAG: Gfo/Idh/MocA family oxidoreductase [Fuerstiella sp.]